ncbi:PREDICTED: uncharacterized protein LOC108967648 [Bactrocera latifrons]|uniref:uncharacterized protein LOC108967648 n=1 Tax=Bactrocera latifrons TaxID=174628 RepID=UPI0008DE4313|nr:PREDICTED: uncharacterized protein LOC108967648 [Bactrocera latifrons]
MWEWDIGRIEQFFRKAAAYIRINSETLLCTYVPLNGASQSVDQVHSESKGASTWYCDSSENNATGISSNLATARSNSCKILDASIVAAYSPDRRAKLMCLKQRKCELKFYGDRRQTCAFTQLVHTK